MSRNFLKNIFLWSLISLELSLAQPGGSYIESALFLFPVADSTAASSFYHTRIILSKSRGQLFSPDWQYAIQLGGVFQQRLSDYRSSILPELYLRSQSRLFSRVGFDFYYRSGITTPNQFYDSKSSFLVRDWAFNFSLPVKDNLNLFFTYGRVNRNTSEYDRADYYLRGGGLFQTKRLFLDYQYENFLQGHENPRHFLYFSYFNPANFTLIGNITGYPSGGRYLYALYQKLRWIPSEKLEMQAEFQEGLYYTLSSEFYRSYFSSFIRRKIKGRWYYSFHLNLDDFKNQQGINEQLRSGYVALDWISTPSSDFNGSIKAGYKDFYRYGRGLSSKGEVRYYKLQNLWGFNLTWQNLVSSEFLYTGNLYRDFTDRLDINLLWRWSGFQIQQRNTFLIHSGEDLLLQPDTIRSGIIERLDLLFSSNGLRFSSGIIWWKEYNSGDYGRTLYGRVRWSSGTHSSFNLYLNYTDFFQATPNRIWFLFFWKYSVFPFNFVVEAGYRGFQDTFILNRLNLTWRLIREF